MTGHDFDLIIAGSGVAGLYAALLAAPHARVLLVTKGVLEESNTRYAQGGIAVALGEADSAELHLRDTIAAGDGLCDPANVSILTREASACITDLIERGVPFDRDGDSLAWTLEAAHSRPRILHAGGDATGARLELTLAQAVRNAGVTVLERTFCTSLLTDGDRVTGVEMLTATGATMCVPAPHVLLATGGAGHLFARTTNPAVATGDGIAIAYRAGAQLMDLEFVQFHPTALNLAGAPSFLISEAVRGEGGILRDNTGYAFMCDYHPDRELAPRDVVARAIHQHSQSSGSKTWLDVTHLDPGLVERRFPSIVRFCRQWGIEPLEEPIPVSPAAHYLMGGIRTNSWGQTSLPGLFACGEVACNAVHGANRLASNSLLEGLVFARRVVHRIRSGRDGFMDRQFDAVAIPVGAAPSGRPPGRGNRTFPATATGSAAAAEGGHSGPPLPVSRRRTELANVMWREASLVRSEESLSRAHDTVLRMSGSNIGRPSTLAEHEMANLTLLAQLVTEAAAQRTESRGAHYRTDFPRSDPAWQGHLVLSRDGVDFLPMTTSQLVGATADG